MSDIATEEVSGAYRIERDSLGDVQVPVDAWYGAQTQRAIHNFPITGLLPHPTMVRATVFVKQAAAEVIMLTHNEELHEVNLGWHPRAEDVLWRPEIQQAKRSQNGARNVRYRNGVKGESVAALRALIDRHTPWLRVRYAF